MTDQETNPLPGTGGEADGISGFLQQEMTRLGLEMVVQEPPLEDVSSLGKGSTGQVASSFDRVLKRTVAVKSLQREYSTRQDQLERMVREARAAAQLEHPNIVPIYGLGVSPTRGVYFTMKQLRGDSLRHVISQLALQNPAYTWEFTLARRLDIFIKLCQGVAYAHSKGILHRDLKPENIRVGNYGEVTIIDWGLVREVSHDAESGAPRHPHSKPRSRQSASRKNDSLSASNMTMDGILSGTPRYMSPEQAGAENSQLDVRSDVYTLGVILYELMTFFNPFYDKETEDDILESVVLATYPHPRQFTTGRDLPRELEAIILKAMSLNREHRYQTVPELLRDIYAYREERRVTAFQSDVLTSLRHTLRRNPVKTGIAVTTILTFLLSLWLLYLINMYMYQSVMLRARNSLEHATRQQNYLLAKQPYAQSMTADTERRLAEMHGEIENDFDSAELLLSSLTSVSPWKKETRTLHIQLCRQRLQFAVQDGRFDDIPRIISKIQTVYGASQDNIPRELQTAIIRAEHARRGICCLTELDSSPPGVPFRLARLITEADGTLTADPLPLIEDVTPLLDFQLSKGDYLCTLEPPGSPPVYYPLHLSHGERRSIHLPLPEVIPQGTVYVPAGEALLGVNSVPTELPAFFIGQHEVTYRQYFQFWKSLPATRRAEHLPMLQFALDQPPQPAWDEQGKLHSCVTWETPVTGVTHDSCSAYCAWLGRQCKRPCRLPSADEWEKAARGVDGRLYPWGNTFVTQYSYTFENLQAHATYQLAAPPGSFPKDTSIYGAADMAGNVREWTDTPCAPGLWVIKGASFAASRRYLPLHESDDTPHLPSDVGFRVLFPQ
ncbi:MAG: SUMF1/EgtB/PvdO family nonheme iron enzyme [Victivallales bacterium]|nr:SUMF1/EgtB/PvdO family nonheme iron enzyme [Victivallales bacterium]